MIQNTELETKVRELGKKIDLVGTAISETILKIDLLAAALSEAKPKIVNIKQAAIRWGFSESYLYKAPKAKGMPTVRVGGKLLFDVEAVESWMRTNPS